MPSGRDWRLSFQQLLATALALHLPTVADAQIAGAWQLTYVEPAEVWATDPRGIANSKVIFESDGKATFFAPDAVPPSGGQVVSYKPEGSALNLQPTRGELHSVAVAFPDADTMVFTPRAGGSKRTFKRLADPFVRLEPKSLQLVKTREPAISEVAFQVSDDPSLPLEKRIQGAWEVIRYRKVPRNQLPPYGFFNDIWTFSESSVRVQRREPATEQTLPYQLRGAAIAMKGAAGAEVTWNVQFNQWGQLVLDSPEVQLTLKLVSRETSGRVSTPLKIVLLEPASH